MVMATVTAVITPMLARAIIIMKAKRSASVKMEGRVSFGPRPIDLCISTDVLCVEIIELPALVVEHVARVGLRLLAPYLHQLRDRATYIMLTYFLLHI